MYKYPSLTPQTARILKDKGTEQPFTGKYCDTQALGTYLCRGCGTPLFLSDSKFLSSCGWPSFDDEIPNAIKRLQDADGRRTEILCRHCDGHLGHIFHGEKLTAKDTRYCVNALSIDFVPHTEIRDTEEIIVAGGCFWGVQHLFETQPGILLTEVGYTSGTVDNPTYNSVCNGNTGHVEAVRILFNPKIITLEQVVQYFFEIHNPAQKDGQGPDIGSQYLSKVFYYSEQQKNSIEQVISTLETNSEKFATTVEPISIFWPAEEFHQHYYQKNNQAPYCHKHTPRT